MVRFKVIKGSHLLLAIAVILLTCVIIGLAINYAIGSHNDTSSAQASLVLNDTTETNSEAETDAVFASLNFSVSSMDLDPEKDGSLSIELSPSPTPTAENQSILIYHTHTHEAYEQVDYDRYEAIEAWRTHDHDHSVVRIGEELANLLRACGFDVIHDTTDHEQDELSTAYTRSLQTLESYKQRFDLYIDLHRDAYIDGTAHHLAAADGQALAPLMILVGNGEGFTTKPFYDENLMFANRLTENINARIPGLCKDVLVKDGRYNQHIGVFSILIEVGHNKNTLQEALNSLPYLAESIQSLMLLEPDEELCKLQQAFLKKCD